MFVLIILIQGAFLNFWTPGLELEKSGTYIKTRQIGIRKKSNPLHASLKKGPNECIVNKEQKFLQIFFIRLYSQKLTNTNFDRRKSHWL